MFLKNLPLCPKNLFYLLFVLQISFGQGFKAKLDSLKHKELNLIPVPSLTVGPEVGIMYGFFVDYYYNAGGKHDSLTRPSISFIDVQHSTNKQFNIELVTSAYTKNEKYFLFIRAGYYNDFEKYWGTTTPTLPQADFINTRYKRYQAFGRALKNLGQQHFIGLGYQFNQYGSFSFAETNFSDFIPKNPNSTILGTGIVYSLDRRNSQFSPSKGIYVDLSAYKMFDLTSSTTGYYQINMDLRKYFEISKHVLANQFVLGSAYGQVPPFEKLRLGGPSMLRGLFKGQFRDNNLWTLQSEYKYEIIPFLKIAYFAALGNTAPTLGSLFKQDLVLGHGIGLRFRLNAHKKVYARLDYGQTNLKTSGFYIKLGDAF